MLARHRRYDQLIRAAACARAPPAVRAMRALLAPCLLALLALLEVPLRPAAAEKFTVNGRVDESGNMKARARPAAAAAAAACRCCCSLPLPLPLPSMRCMTCFAQSAIALQASRAQQPPSQ